jgi:ankyrin repeat protein
MIRRLAAIVLPAFLVSQALALQTAPPATPPAADPAAAPAAAPKPKKQRSEADGQQEVGAGMTREQKIRNAVSQTSAPTAHGGEESLPTNAPVQAPVDDKPVLKLEPEVLDLGEMVVDTAKSGKVKLINISDKPVTVTKAITSCGCTTAGAPKDPIPPGGSAEVEISLKPGPKPGVPLSKRVTFQIDGHAPAMLTVQGKVPAYITMTPDLLEAPGEGKTSEGTITLKSVDNTPFKITAVVPPIVPDAGNDAKAEHVVHVDWKAWDETGKTIKLTLSTDHPKVPSLSCLIRRPMNASGDPKAPAGPSPAERAASALVTAARSGDVEKVKKQLADGANVNAPDSAGGRTALHWAAKEGKTEVIPVLLSKGADVNVKDRSGKTPLCIAGENGRADAVKLLLAANADVNVTDRMGGTPLMWSAALGTPETVALLIEKGASVNVSDKNGLTPLLWASSTGDPKTVALLIEKKADIGVADNLTGDTALMRAARNGKLDSVKALLDAKAAIEATNRQGMTTWLIAAANGKAEKLIMLKTAGANIQAKDARGWNAVDHARARSDANRAEVLKYLEEELKLKPAIAETQGAK